MLRPGRPPNPGRSHFSIYSDSPSGLLRFGLDKGDLWKSIDGGLTWTVMAGLPPRSAVSVGVTIHELGPWNASVYMRYFGPRPLIEDDSVRSMASTIFNGQVSYRVTPWARLIFDVFNLFNAQVDDIAYFYRSRLRGEQAAGVDDVHFHPAENRSVRFTAAFTFY